MTYTTEALIEGEEVEITMRTDDGEQDGSLKVVEIESDKIARVEDQNGMKLELNFWEPDAICAVMTGDGTERQLAEITEMGGY